MWQQRQSVTVLPEFCKCLVPFPKRSGPEKWARPCLCAKQKAKHRKRWGYCGEKWGRHIAHPLAASRQKGSTGAPKSPLRVLWRLVAEASAAALGKGGLAYSTHPAVERRAWQTSTYRFAWGLVMSTIPLVMTNYLSRLELFLLSVLRNELTV